MARKHGSSASDCVLGVSFRAPPANILIQNTTRSQHARGEGSWGWTGSNNNHSGVGSCDLLRMRKYSFRGESQERDGGLSVYKRQGPTKTPFCCQNFYRADS